MILPNTDVKKKPYQKVAQYYDRLYYWKDYEKESKLVKKIILKYKKSIGKDLLEVACGTGGHLKYLRSDFHILATDASAEMLHIAREKFPHVEFKRMDMVNLHLNRQFDIILCLFGSIGYVKTKGNLDKTLRAFSSHLKKGGVAIIDPWFTPTDRELKRLWMSTYKDEKIKIARMAVPKVIQRISIFDFTYLIADKKSGVRVVSNHHVLGLFKTTEMLQAFKRAGLRPAYLPKGFSKGRGLLVGIKK